MRRVTLAAVLAALFLLPAEPSEAISWITSPLLIRAFDGATTVAGLSPCNTKRIGVHTVVVDALSDASCSIAGGTTMLDCLCNGTSYVPRGVVGADGQPRVIAEEGTSLTTRGKVNFIGGSITCVDNAGADRTDCTVDTYPKLLATPPFACDAGHERSLYSDTSHALCWCSASAWVVVAGAGTCE
jgi:hypothetical protein